MRLRRHVPLLQKSLKHNVSLRPLLLSQWIRHRRPYTQTSAAHPEEIAVLGGGIAGLASAHFATKEFPKSRITLYESSKDLGGWIKSKKVKVPGGEVIFEYGPRTLRPGAGAAATIQLIHDLGLNNQVLSTPKNTPAARNRYLYYPDRINRLPAALSDLNFPYAFKLFQAGLLSGVWSIVSEYWRPRRSSRITDESVGDFVSRRWDKRIADNLLSAGFHGIYAGDIYQLSAKTLLAPAWYLETKYGSISRGIAAISQDDATAGHMPWHPYVHEQYNAITEDMDVDEEFMRILSKQSTFYFKEGMQHLPLTLANKLRSNPQVEIVTGTSVNETRMEDGGSKIEIITGHPSSPTPRTFDFVISSLPTKSLTPTVTTMVVNLWFSNPHLLSSTPGFGYLIPRSIPFDQNPERALGVIFDHDATLGQDSIPGTKLTVMLGGHWWDGWTEFPDEGEGAAYARAILQRHLGITAEPDECHVTLNRNCIAQYTVGYEERGKRLDEQLRKDYNGRVRVVGSQYNGVGVNDCIRGAWEVVRGMRGGGWKAKRTGLERFTDERDWVLVPPTGKYK